MRTVEKTQVLTTGRVDFNGNQIPPDIIEWDEYNQNPVLLYDRRYEGHNGVVVGKVINIKRSGNGFVGNLSFMERFEDADIAYEKYTQGVLPYVSIGGYAIGEEKEGVFIAMRYRVREFSLVKFPANIDAKQIDASTLDGDDKRIFDEMATTGLEVRYLTMSCEFLNVSNMEEQETNASEETEQTTETQEQETNASEETEQTAETQEQETNASEETEQTAETQEQETNASENRNESAGNPPNGMEWHERNSNNNNTNIMPLEFRQLQCDADFQRRMNALNSAYRAGANVADATPENAETVRILAASMLQDQNLVILANATNVTDGVTRGRRNALEILVECAAGGAAAATLAAADLGVIKYLSLVYEQLLANDTFRRSICFVPMSDRTGSIYIESGINAPTFVGNVTPVNAQRYFYDDIKRTIARRVFTFAPVTFQHADLAVLAYAKQSLGISEQMDKLMSDISTYWLQVVANTPGIATVGTTGAVVNTSNLFPIEAPASNVNIHKPTLNDIVDLEGVFLMQNYRLNGKQVEVVLPSRVYSMLAGDEEVRSQLTRELNARIAAEIHFSASRITPRNPAARYNTAAGAVELDPAMYADNNTADNGTFTPIVPATTTADHIGAGVAFVENEVLAGVGAIELIVMPDPQNYGTTISGWVSTGCTIARQNGVGAALLVPTV